MKPFLDGAPGRVQRLRHRLGLLAVASEPAASAVLRPAHTSYLERTRRHDDVAIFLVPFSRGGGIISIYELARTSRRIGLALGFDVRVAYQPGHFPRLQHPQGRGEVVTSPEAVLDAYRNAQRVWVHVPEYAFVKHLGHYREQLSWLATSGVDVVVNILNQNITMMPTPEQVEAVCGDAAFRTTVTTAHHTYCRADLQVRYGMPWHHFSTWIDPRDYEFARYRPDRADRMVLSPDRSAARDGVVGALAAGRPSTEITTVASMTYEDYLRLVYSSKWSLTFGEGLDGYFIEMGLSLGVPFAVYNDEFFTEDFLELPTVFTSWDELTERLPIVVNELGRDHDRYRSVADEVATMLSRYYDLRDHVDRMARYYAGDYDLR